MVSHRLVYIDSARWYRRLDTRSALFRHMPQQCPRSLQSPPTPQTPPAPCAPDADVKRPKLSVSTSARDPSTRVPASDSPDCHRPPATRTLPLPTITSAHPYIGLSWPQPLRHRESDAASVAARAASHLVPYPAHG